VPLYALLEFSFLIKPKIKREKKEVKKKKKVKLKVIKEVLYKR